jgi:hypothetical protein
VNLVAPNWNEISDSNEQGTGKDQSIDLSMTQRKAVLFRTAVESGIEFQGESARDLIVEDLHGRFVTEDHRSAAVDNRIGSVNNFLPVEIQSFELGLPVALQLNV